MLTAMGYPAEEARGALRLSASGRTTTDAEIDEAARIVPGVIERAAAAGEVAPRPTAMVSAVAG